MDFLYHLVQNEETVEPVSDTVSDTVNEPIVLTEEIIEKLSTDAGKTELENMEEKINPTPEEISRLEDALKKKFVLL